LESQESIVVDIVRIKRYEPLVACNRVFLRALRIERKCLFVCIEIGGEHLCGKRRGILTNVARNVGNLRNGLAREIISLYHLTVLQEIILRKDLREPYLLIAERNVDNVQGREGEDERENGILGQQFCDFYSAKGWKIGKEPMKDWKAAVRTWEMRRKDQSPSIAQPQPQISTPKRIRFDEYGNEIVY